MLHSQLLPLLLLALPQERAKPAPEHLEFFEKHIRPLLVDRCHSCHSTSAKKLKGGLHLDSREGLLKGGDGGPAIVPGKPDESRLIKALRYQDEELQMPPKGRFTREQLALFEKWVLMGAPHPDAATRTVPKAVINFEEARKFWSFQPLRDPAPPAVKDARWPASPIDRFILARIEEKGLTPSGEADKRVLIRRATFDLIGLPPAPGEIEQFLRDPSPDAYAGLIERLLASPHYGERWGRHWLDVVRYSDTAGDNSDYPVPQMYLYRNYVIDSFNRDLPYDRFLREQIAGDLLPHADEAERRRLLIATGYIANSRRFGSGIKDYPQWLTIDDTLDNLGRTVLGLTINCARCHDHKFDPITSADYYALYGIFNSTRYPFPGIELDKRPRDLVPLLPTAEFEAVMKPYKDRLAALEGEVTRLDESSTGDREARLKLEDSLKTAQERKETETIQKIESEIAELRKKRDRLKTAVANARKKRDDFKATLPVVESAYAVAEAKPANARILVRGEPKDPGAEVPRRFLEVLGGAPLPPDCRTSGRDALAGWLTDPGNPLTARVMVNRIWQYHFGRGIVPTPSDFGIQGTPPSHPALLDWLALRFVENRWSIKAMHRMIMNSSTYRQSSLESQGKMGLDPANELLARFSRRRLDGESIRDALLAVSGALDRTPGAGHPFPPVNTWGFTQHVPYAATYETNRRSVYVMTQRLKKHPFFELFDGPDTNASTPVRADTTTPLQALYVMNDPFFHDQSYKLALRLLKEQPDDESRLRSATLMAFGRPVTEDEMRSGLAFLKQVRGKADSDRKAWTSLCRVLLRLNEFLYVD